HSQLIRLHDDQTTHGTEEHLARRGGCTRPRPMIRDRRAFGEPQAANSERARIDDRQTIIRTGPDPTVRILEQLVHIFAGKTLTGAEPDEMWPVIGVPTIHHTDTAAESAYPKTPAAINEQCRHIARRQRRGVL